MSTITKEQAKDLRNAFECWQQDYDPVEDKEQYDMFGLGMVAMDALLASLEAEPAAYSLILRNMEGVLNGHVNANTTFSTMEKAQAYGKGGNYVRQNDGSLQWVSDPSLDPVVVPLYAAPPAPVFVPAAYEHTEDFSEYHEGWNACRAAMLQGAGPVNNRDELPEVVLHMGQAMSVFEALKKEILYEHVRHAELGAMGAVNVQVWTSVLGGTLQYETSNGGCTLRVTQAASQQELRRELFVSSEGNNCSKHPDTQLINHPHLQTASIPPHPVKYCPKCEPGVSQINAFRLPDEWHCNVNTKYFIYSPSVKSDKKITFVNSIFANCSEPEGDIQFINCTLPEEWEGKVNAIDCVFKAAPQQEGK
ncbi:hypothetical protein KD741_07390 [Escherichia coli]|uniref:hypothetical protein n=1 Tax=Escherichia coli TaxID=562 RepID=UPI001CEC0D9E|nr:hypothetical protein [Escherichia coli]MCA6195352.1 hypothetical protein [Escherichia coli]